MYLMNRSRQEEIGELRRVIGHKEASGRSVCGRDVRVLIAMPSPRFTVGYALTDKKTKSFMQPKLESHARYTTRKLIRSAPPPAPSSVCFQSLPS